MKKILFPSVLCLISYLAMSQCDKYVTWTASKGEMIDENGNVVDTKVGKIVIETSRTSFSLIFDDNEMEALRGNVKEVTCDWKIPYKSGKTTFKSSISGGNETRDGEVIIEGKEDKITILIDTKKRKFRFVVDGYKENN